MLTYLESNVFLITLNIGLYANEFLVLNLKSGRNVNKLGAPGVTARWHGTESGGQWP